MGKLQKKKKKALEINGRGVMWEKKIVHRANGQMSDTLPDSHIAS